jgi:hypothetical protein
MSSLVHRTPVLALFLFAPIVACQVERGGDTGYTKDEARALNGVTSDGDDICALEGWYDDDVCDDFCPQFDQLDCPVSNECPDPNDPAVHYRGGPDDDIVCAQEIGCPDGQVLFNNADCGCGCIDLPETCGGIAGIECPSGQFCDLPACGIADQLGVCKAVPEACPEIYSPVCGCDGQTYANECFAHGAGVSVQHLGECGSPPGDVCGGIAGLTCSPGFFCNYTLDQLCGAADDLGECDPIPEACPEIYSPVCGCDGVTYGNACEANAAGVAVAAEGNCLAF